jgi:hypothetical protein
MTGVAATLLLGEMMTHSAIYLNNKSIKSKHIKAWRGTRLLIIDEMSFASKPEFEKLNHNLCHLMQKLHLPYGEINIVFSGDMHQLEPFGKKRAVYQDDCPEFKDWVNCFIELTGMHRFKDDPRWGQVLL